MRVPARGPPGAAHGGEPPRRRAGQPAAAPRRPLRRRVGVRPQGRAAHLGARPGRRRRLRARRPRRSSATTPGSLVSDLGGPGRHGDEGRGDRRRARRPRRRPSSSRSSSGSSHEGYLFEAADASLELLMRKATGWEQPFFRLEGYRVTSYHRDASRVPVEDGEGWSTPRPRSRCGSATSACIAVGEGNGPVNALDAALRPALNGAVPGARPHPPHRLQGAGARRRRRTPARSSGCSSTRPTATTIWTTIGVSTNIIEASWQALVDSLVYGLLHAS